jgi:hypothetical protein
MGVGGIVSRISAQNITVYVESVTIIMLLSGFLSDMMNLATIEMHPIDQVILMRPSENELSNATLTTFISMRANHAASGHNKHMKPKNMKLCRDEENIGVYDMGRVVDSPIFP